MKLRQSLKLRQSVKLWHSMKLNSLWNSNMYRIMYRQRHHQRQHRHQNVVFPSLAYNVMEWHRFSLWFARNAENHTNNNEEKTYQDTCTRACRHLCPQFVSACVCACVCICVWMCGACLTTCKPLSPSLFLSRVPSKASVFSPVSTHPHTWVDGRFPEKPGSSSSENKSHWIA